MWTIIRELTQRGYSVTISCERADRTRMPTRPEDIEIGRGKPFYCAINNSGSATGFVTGYGAAPSEAIAMAMKKAGVQIPGITL